MPTPKPLWQGILTHAEGRWRLTRETGPGALEYAAPSPEELCATLSYHLEPRLCAKVAFLVRLAVQWWDGEPRELTVERIGEEGNA